MADSYVVGHYTVDTAKRFGTNDRCQLPADGIGISGNCKARTWKSAKRRFCAWGGRDVPIFHCGMISFDNPAGGA